jgi:hypothetical protein
MPAVRSRRAGGETRLPRLNFRPGLIYHPRENQTRSNFRILARALEIRKVRFKTAARLPENQTRSDFTIYEKLDRV